MKKKLVYVAHPYGGKKSNKEKIDKIMQELVMVDIHMTMYHLSIIMGLCT